MMKKHLFVLLALLALVSCKEVKFQPRPALPLVHVLAADSTGTARLVAQSGTRGGEGSIAIIGDPEAAILLARRFQGSDRVDNIDGRPQRDSLPDFAGETFDVVMDAYNAPYDRFWESARNLADTLRQNVLDSLREIAVLNAVNAWDSLCWRSVTDTEPLLRKQRAKMLIFTSAMQARWGVFDVDTLQQLCGGNCPVLSPVHSMLDQAYAAGARSLAVWTSRNVRDSGAWQEVFGQKGYADAHLTVLAPESALDIRTELRNLLRQYRETGRVLDALLIDSYTADLSPLRSELDLIHHEGTDENAAFQAMLSPDFFLVDPLSSLVGTTYALMRERHMFSHQIAWPAIHYYETAVSDEGAALLVETSASYAINTYVPNRY